MRVLHAPHVAHDVPRGRPAASLQRPQDGHLDGRDALQPGAEDDHLWQGTPTADDWGAWWHGRLVRRGPGISRPHGG